MAVSRRTAANESKYSCASEEVCTKKSAAPIPARIVLSKLRSLSTMTLATTISVKTGKSRERMLTATHNHTTYTNVRANFAMKDNNPERAACHSWTSEKPSG